MTAQLNPTDIKSIIANRFYRQHHRKIKVDLPLDAYRLLQLRNYEQLWRILAIDDRGNQVTFGYPPPPTNMPTLATPFPPSTRPNLDFIMVKLRDKLMDNLRTTPIATPTRIKFENSQISKIFEPLLDQLETHSDHAIVFACQHQCAQARASVDNNPNN